MHREYVAVAGHGAWLAVLFYLQVTPMLLTKFHVIWPFSSGEMLKINFKHGGHGGYLLTKYMGKK